MKRFQDWKFLAAMVMTASVVAMTAVVCAKSVSVLFKLDKALTLYLRENKTAKKPAAVKPFENMGKIFQMRICLAFELVWAGIFGGRKALFKQNR